MKLEYDMNKNYTKLYNEAQGVYVAKKIRKGRQLVICYLTNW